jgi:hypothetical protein
MVDSLFIYCNNVTAISELVSPTKSPRPPKHSAAPNVCDEPCSQNDHSTRLPDDVATRASATVTCATPVQMSMRLCEQEWGQQNGIRRNACTHARIAHAHANLHTCTPAHPHTHTHTDASPKPAVTKKAPSTSDSVSMPRLQVSGPTRGERVSRPLEASRIFETPSVPAPKIA